MNERPADRLVQLLRTNRQERKEAVDLAPTSTFEAVTRQMVVDLAREIGELRRRIDALFYVVISAVLVDVVGRVSGGW